jgi:alanyl-tRNA synthetase
LFNEVDDYLADLAEIAKGVSPTVHAYWKDSYLSTLSSQLLRVVPDEKKFWYVVLDETIFHPKGGGQPSDKGTLQGPGFKLDVRKAMFAGPVIVHWGKLAEGAPAEGPVKTELDWNWRYLMMRRHSAGHLLDHVLAEVVGHNVETMDSWLGEPCYVAYKGNQPSVEELVRIEEEENKVIRRGGPIVTRQVTEEELRKNFSDSPNFERLPSSKQLRLVTIEGSRPIACGGTHLRNISEAKGVRVKSAEKVEGGFRIYYDVI